MNHLLCPVVILTVSGICSFCFNRSNKIANITGMLGSVLASFFGLIGLIIAFQKGLSSSHVPWPVPFGSFSIAVDSLSLLFLFPLFIISALSALYGFEYLKHYYGKKNIGSAWFFFNFLVASIILVLVARNAILFLAGWEVMSVTSFFLVLFEGEKREACRAGMLYLVATHIGTLFLLVMFILLGKSGGGSFYFGDWDMTGLGLMTSITFICALIGFGTKAGLMPMHIWLPEAHPAAPSHVSAFMSGVMIKTGIYGILRVLTFLGGPLAWWGYLLIVIGMISGILGVLFALAEKDIKRLLAYSSIENIGIISIGMGLGVLGSSFHNPALASLGFAGALLHVINHSFFKGLLFLGAGTVLHETGTREIDVLGGLFKRMPVTGVCFLLGSAAICGLPPLNGFVSEFLIYYAAFKNIFGTTAVFISLVVIASLALIGALAAACFAKAFGIIFLGEPRGVCYMKVSDPGLLMRIPMVILSGACIMAGLGAPLIVALLPKTVVDLTRASIDDVSISLFTTIHPFMSIVMVSSVFLLIVAVLTVLRRRLLHTRRIMRAPTWDCGYAMPHPRMQYTGSSFAQPIVDFFKGILRTYNVAPKINEYFPDGASFKTRTGDLFNETFFRPSIRMIHFAAERMKLIQHGKLQIYVMYILITLIALFIWKF
ncbi:MAG: proton-conducting transporter membrane subunit [Candidatus Omnitrophota bacterium]